MLQKSDYDAFFKEYWTPLAKEKLFFENRPSLAMIEKSTEATGEYIIVPIYLDEGADGSPTFGDAQAVAQSSNTDGQRKQFVCQYVEDFQITQISNKVIKLSKDAKGSLQRAAEEHRAKRNVFMQRIARNMWRQGYGKLGKVDTAVSATSTKVIGLTDKHDARNFRIGQRVVFAASNTAALRGDGAYLTVTAIDFDNKKITTDAPTDLATSIASIANSDTVYLKGARGSGASPTKLTMDGVPSWIPVTAPTAGDSFNGQDRSVWPDRMAGLRYNAGTAVSGAIREIFLDSLVEAQVREANTTHSFVEPRLYAQLLKDMEGEAEKINEKVGKIGFSGFEVQVGMGSGGNKVFPESNIELNYAYHLKLDTWKIYTAGELIHNDLRNGESRDVENGSAIEYRDAFLGQTTCNAPGKNMVVLFA